MLLVLLLLFVCLFVCRLSFALCSLLFALCALRFALCALRFALCALCFVLCALRFALCALRFALCASKSKILVRIMKRYRKRAYQKMSNFTNLHLCWCGCLDRRILSAGSALSSGSWWFVQVFRLRIPKMRLITNCVDLEKYNGDSHFPLRSALIPPRSDL